jgi:hypothetical protein
MYSCLSLLYSTGYSSNGTKQCGETTFFLEKFAVKSAAGTGKYDIMWKYFAEASSYALRTL